MSSATLTCRCRYCGYVLSYLKEDVGMDARCPQCGQTIRLPGKLAAVATIIRQRRKEPLGLTLEIIGFLCLPFLFPWGLLLGAALIAVGWRKSNILLCSNCGAHVANRKVAQCGHCRTRFGTE